MLPLMPLLLKRCSIIRLLCVCPRLAPRLLKPPQVLLLVLLWLLPLLLLRLLSMPLTSPIKHKLRVFLLLFILVLGRSISLHLVRMVKSRVWLIPLLPFMRINTMVKFCSDRLFVILDVLFIERFGMRFRQFLINGRGCKALRCILDHLGKR